MMKCKPLDDVSQTLVANFASAAKKCAYTETHSLAVKFLKSIFINLGGVQRA